MHVCLLLKIVNWKSLLGNWASLQTHTLQYMYNERCVAGILIHFSILFKVLFFLLVMISLGINLSALIFWR